MSRARAPRPEVPARSDGAGHAVRGRRHKPAAGEGSVEAAAPDPAHARVLRQFRIVFNAVKTHFQQVERQAGIGGAQVWALSIICDRPGIGVNDLAQALNIRQPTASNLVKGLIHQELIEARREGRDRRAVQLHVRPEGRRVLRKAPGPFTGVLPAALASLPPAVLDRLEGDLHTLIEALDTDHLAANVPLAHL